MKQFLRRTQDAVYAFQWNENNLVAELPDAVEKWPGIGGVVSEVQPTEGLRLCIATNGGIVVARPGDWIINSQLNGIYPCKPETFDVLYMACD